MVHRIRRSDTFSFLAGLEWTEVFRARSGCLRLSCMRRTSFTDDATSNQIPIQHLNRIHNKNPCFCQEALNLLEELSPWQRIHGVANDPNRHNDRRTEIGSKEEKSKEKEGGFGDYLRRQRRQGGNLGSSEADRCHPKRPEG